MSSRARGFLEMIKFSHSVFALPFALAAAVLAGGVAPGRGWDWVWIVVCVVAARTCAMSFNRIVDRDIDAENPRTAGRHLPAGLLSLRFAMGATILAAAVFLLGAAMLNPLTLALSPLVLGWLLGYSYAKRFTSLAHLWLGVALGLAPVGAWIAIRGSFVEDWPVPVLLATVVTLWTAGFDIIYACQDEEFDRATGLRSVPVRLGRAGALRLSRGLHLVMVVILAGLPVVWGNLGLIYECGVALVAALLAYEHSLVKPDDMSRVDLAFFTLNGVVSILLGAVLATDHLL